MASSIPRPIPVGVNRSGTPIWDGNDNRRFREAHGVTEGFVARAMSVRLGELSAVYEQARTPVAIRYDRIERYFSAVERMAVQRDQKAAKARSELKARIAERSA